MCRSNHENSTPIIVGTKYQIPNSKFQIPNSKFQKKKIDYNLKLTEN